MEESVPFQVGEVNPIGTGCQVWCDRVGERGDTIMGGVMAEDPVSYGTPADSKRKLKRMSYQLAVAIVKTSRHTADQRRYKLADQLQRAGTSPGAMAYEYEFAESPADRIHKLSVALKEANETRYSICLARDCGTINKPTFRALIDLVNPFIRILRRYRDHERR